ncbi:MAG: EamA family transporter [Cereibacter sphaeroides]|uniref:EamA family transporter n=1 Tax=Cereibacter sphaeroides TaxID=1063 RepID=A0A2W5RV51_CERSP|nr:MAG: EamA family transporter [Cereibacter sphaeroides]
MTNSENLRGALYMMVAMAAFTLNDAAMKVATETVPLFQATAMRGTVTTAMLVFLGFSLGGFGRNISPRDLGLVAVRSVAEIGATLFFLLALVHMPLANLSAIMQCLPLAVTLGAALIFRDRIGWRRMLAIAIGFGGVLIILRPGAAGFDEWSAMGLASVACVVVRDLATRRLSRDIPSVFVALSSAVAVLAMGLVGMTATGVQAVSLHECVVIAAASVALIAGYMSGVMAMRVGDIGFIAPFRYTSLVWAIGLGWMVFGTFPDWLTLLGAGIVIATGIFTLYRERKLAQVRRAAE